MRPATAFVIPLAALLGTFLSPGRPAGAEPARQAPDTAASVRAAPTDGGEIRLSPGFQAVVNAGHLTRTSVGDPAVATASPLPGEDGILLVAKSEGSTDLIAWGKGWSRRWRVVVEGTAKPAPERVLLAYDLKIVEISRGETIRAGVRWPDAVPLRVAGGDLPAAGGGGPSAFSVGTAFEARLEMLMAEGKARILASPRIVCQAGRTARFVAGGEIPIVVLTQETRSVTWKPYGIVLEIEPFPARAGQVDTRVVAEVSTIDHGTGTAEIPGFLTRRVETRFSSRAGSTVLLSGLVRSDMAKDVSKVPLLGQIPVLGELFKSRGFRESRTELAVFVTATVPGDDGHGMDDWEARREEAEGSLRFRLMD